MTEPEWNVLEEPRILSEDRYGKTPFPEEAGIQLKVKSGADIELWLVGDVINLWTDEGCGCCAENRWEEIIAWRRLIPKEWLDS